MSLSSTSSSSRKRDKASRTLVWFVALLAAAELTLLGLEITGEIPEGIPEGPLIHINLGSSRSLRSIMPLQIEKQLEDQGVDGIWIANVARLGRTMVGVAQTYSEEVAPRIHPRHRLGTLAIEVRGASLNDSRVKGKETGFGWQIWASQRRLTLTERLESWFQGLKITDLRKALESTDTGQPAWAKGARGWQAFGKGRARDVTGKRSRRLYTKLLRDYKLGGRQTIATRYLIRRAQEDGWTPVLYAMPITPMHRGFFEPGDYQAFLAQTKRIAAEEGVAWVDLDTGHSIERRNFFDTHHLDSRGARLFSRCFGASVLHEPSRTRLIASDSPNACLSTPARLRRPPAPK